MGCVPPLPISTSPVGCVLPRSRRAVTAEGTRACPAADFGGELQATPSLRKSGETVLSEPWDTVEVGDPPSQTWPPHTCGAQDTLMEGCPLAGKGDAGGKGLTLTALTTSLSYTLGQGSPRGQAFPLAWAHACARAVPVVIPLCGPLLSHSSPSPAWQARMPLCRPAVLQAKGE